MLEITYRGMFLFITLAWIAVRVFYCVRDGRVDRKHEVKLLLVYICLVVIARFVYFPMHPVDGRIASLYLDDSKIFPIWYNLVPIVHLFDVYDGWQLNIIGNITMFIPVGLVWPFCFKELNTLRKALLAGVCFPLLIEISQLPLYDRCSDIDDLILNSTGFFIGALIYFGIKRLKSRKKKA